MSENIPENDIQNQLDKNQIKSQIKPNSKNIALKNSVNNESNSASNVTPRARDFNYYYPQNSSKSLLKNVQFLDEENNKLKLLITDMNNELKEKEETLNESQKIILKLKEEYSQIMKEYKKLENEKNKLLGKKESNQKILDNMSKNQSEYERVLKLNEHLKMELIRTKENLNYYKNNFSNAAIDINKLEKHNKTKEMIIKDLKIEGDKCLNMLRDRDLLIESYSKKINELNQIINQKNEQLKLMINFSKEINNENKSNVKEITKQAVKTIKVFYNTLNNKDNKNQVNFIEIRNNGYISNLKSPEINNENNFSNDMVILSNLFDNKLNSEKCSILLQDSLKDLLYIPEEGVNYINKEFLIDNNFKTSLIKTELFSSLIRENNLYTFFRNIFGKVDLALTFNTGIHEKVLKMNEFKFQFNHMKNLYEAYYKENSILKNKLKEMNLYIEKLKYDMDKKNKKYKDKILELINLIEFNDNNLNKEKDKETTQNIIKKLKNEISNLNAKIDRINNENYNLTEKNIEKDNLIDNLKKEIEKLNLKINSLRTNPLAENNIKYLEKKENSSQTENNYNENLNNNEMNGSSSFSRNKKERKKYYLTSEKKKFEVQPRERFTYYLESKKKEKDFKKERDKENLSLNYITPIKINNNNINNNINEKYEINSFSKITNLDNILEVQQNSDLNNQYNINNNRSSLFREDFKKELKENNFMIVAQKNISISKCFSVLTNKIEQVKNLIFSVKEKLKKLKPDKKLSQHHFFQVLNRLEKYISYIFIFLNQSNGQILSILPTVSIIYNLISKFVYNKPFKIFSDTQNNIFNFEDKENSKFEFNEQIEDIQFDYSSNTSKESIIPNIQELKQFFDINKKIFSSSELIKYRNIYINLSMSQIIKVFKETCTNLKKTIHNLRQNYKSNNSEYSDFSETMNSKMKSQKEYTGNCDDYRIVNEKILNLKKFEFDFKILMELLKNYFVCFEIIVKKIEKETQRKNKGNLVQLGEEVNIIYNLFEDVVYYKIDDLDDDTIFNRKVILKLVQNHKEYLTIMYDLRF